MRHNRVSMSFSGSIRSRSIRATLIAVDERDSTAPMAQSPASGRLARIRFVQDGSRREVPIASATLVGGASSCALVVAGPTVSRLHAELEPRDDGVWVRDLGSTNGVFVDGIRVERARIPDGAILRLGDVELEVRYESAASAAYAPWPYDTFGELLGASLAMREVFATTARAAATSSAVLVQGETGTGKELIAKSLHECSKRASGPLVTVDCAALPENLLESELFGHARGAFTGAVAARAGAFEAASGGTIFLDEIGELPLVVQPKLLRALESKTVRRLGESTHRPVDIRVVSATHRDLSGMVACGAFREDLYFRLAVLAVKLPPLRERRGDIGVLLGKFLGQPVGEVFDDEAQRAIAQHPWLGNIRELRNFAERTLAFGAESALNELRGARASVMPAEDVETPSARVLPSHLDAELAPRPATESYGTFRERWIDAGEASYVRSLLELHGGNVTRAAEAAGVARAHLYRLIKKHRI
jgi:two-component system, NtrC family, response regulator GlrR